MSIAQSMLAEFEAQALVTRRFLERLPEDKPTWKPHEKSMSAGQLALHLARVPGAVIQAAQQDSIQPLDFGNLPQPSSVHEVLTAFEESVATVRKILPHFDDGRMQQTWRIVQGGTEILAVPRAEFVRNIMLSHWYQHRGQFSVYLRLLNVPVPATWGPSADEQPAPLRRSESA
jgi:uncharacterized damage-inducible protein DinB